jgi:hypothetical protein
MTVSAVVWRHASVRAHNSSRANITKRPSTPGSLPLRRRPMCWGTPPSSGFVSIVVAAQGAVIDKSRRTEPGSRRCDAGLTVEGSVSGYCQSPMTGALGRSAPKGEP